MRANPGSQDLEVLRGLLALHQGPDAGVLQHPDLRLPGQAAGRSFQGSCSLAFSPLASHHAASRQMPTLIRHPGGLPVHWGPAGRLAWLWVTESHTWSILARCRVLAPLGSWGLTSSYTCSPFTQQNLPSRSTSPFYVNLNISSSCSTHPLKWFPSTVDIKGCTIFVEGLWGRAVPRTVGYSAASLPGFCPLDANSNPSPQALMTKIGLQT